MIRDDNKCMTAIENLIHKRNKFTKVLTSGIIFKRLSSAQSSTLCVIFDMWDPY